MKFLLLIFSFFCCLLSQQSFAQTTPPVDSARKLKEVTVRGSKPFIEHQLDRTTINIGALLINTGTNIVEVLNNTPGIEIVDQTISLRGKANVMVYIDGRQSFLAGKDLMNYLQSLPSGSMDKIELMPNPPANFHVNGNAGVINLITKKNKAQGFNGTLALGYAQGRYSKTIDNINLNYHKGKINVYGNLGYSNTNNYYDVDRSRFIKDATAQYLVDQQNDERSDLKGYNYKAGIDFDLDKHNNLGLSINSLNDTYDETGIYKLVFKQPESSPDSLVNTQSGLSEKTSTRSYNINYSHSFKIPERNIQFSLDYLNYNKKSDQNLNTKSYFSENTVPYDTYSLHTDNKFEADIYSARIDYNSPALLGITVATGIQTIQSRTNSNNQYNGQLDNFNLEGQLLKNLLTYLENINGAYLNLSKSIQRFAMQAGLRYEHTNAGIQQLQNNGPSNDVNRYSSGNLIPTIYLSYKLDTTGKNSLLFSYGRRVSRPGYQNLNPSIFFFDRYTSNQGNPFLQPERSSSFDMTYHYGSNFSLGSSISYSRNAIIPFYKFTANTLINTAVNIDRLNNYQLYINYSVTATTKWSINLYQELTRSIYKGVVADYGDLKNTVTAFRFTGSSQYQVSDKWTTELTGQYRSRRTYGQGIYSPLVVLNGSVQKKIFNSRASLSLVARDVFHTSVIKRELNVKNTRIRIRNENDTQVISLNFSYKFGTGIAGKSSKPGLENERKRVGI